MRKFFLITLFLLSINVSSYGDLPSIALRVNGSFKVFNSYAETDNGKAGIVDNADLTITVREFGAGKYQAVIEPKTNIADIWFPWKPSYDNISETYSVTDTLWSGTTTLSTGLSDWGWKGYQYPGTLAAPILVTEGGGQSRILAAINWPPKKVKLMYSKNRETIVYSAQPNEKMIILRFMDITKPGSWHGVVDEYKNWLEPNLEANRLKDVYPAWLKKSNGFINIQLENIWGEFTPEKITSMNDQWGQYFPWIQMWGQMSNYTGPSHLAVPPLEEGEEVGCCLVKQEMHPKYISMLSWIESYINNGQNRVGYYTRPYPKEVVESGEVSVQENLRFAKKWMDKNQKDYHANAHYFDVIGAEYFGDPLEVADSLRKMSRNMFIESPVDIYPKSYLMSGSYNFSNAKPEFVRYLLGDKITFLGESNGGYNYWGESNSYWMERQVFLMGAKFDVMHPNDFVVHVCKLRDSVNWWNKNPIFKDVVGLSDVPEGVNIKVFSCEDGDYFTIDNWGQITGTFKYQGQIVDLTDKKIDIVRFSVDNSVVR